jgi:hypothetical protein
MITTTTGGGAMESFDYLSELSKTVSGSSADGRLREAHAAMVELDRDRGQPLCVWHAGCNTALMTSCLDAESPQDREAESARGGASTR